jgi:hypothetical protein
VLVSSSENDGTFKTLKRAVSEVLERRNYKQIERG